MNRANTYPVFVSDTRLFLTALLLVAVSIYFGSEIYELFVALQSDSGQPVHEPVWFIIFEIVVILCALCWLYYLARSLIWEKRRLKALQEEHSAVQRLLSDANEKLQEGKRNFSEVIKWQFSEWGLSPSEEEVALQMLKGLSFKEIALVRNTHEKTVRQQASSIYSKTNLGGRHEFAAWFFEELL